MKMCSQHHYIDPPGVQISNPFITNTRQEFSSNGDSYGSPNGDSYGSPNGDSYGSPNGDSYGSPVDQGIIQPRNPSVGIGASDSYGINNIGDAPIQEAVNVASQASILVRSRNHISSIYTWWGIWMYACVRLTLIWAILLPA